MRIFCIGDIVGRCGREAVERELAGIIRSENIDLTIANGENLSHGRGISRNYYDQMLDAGVDGITLGNHTWNNKDVINLLKYNKNIVRPLNFSRECPGSGSMLLKSKGGTSVGVINLIGRVYMEPCNNPFEAVKKEIEKLKRDTDIILVDFHAEATSEKMAMGWYLDGSVSAVFGTHTHVQTADETILPKGTGYITDLGMTGPVYSVLGMERKAIITKFIDGMPQRFEVADGASMLSGCIFDIGLDGKTTKVKRVCLK